MKPPLSVRSKLTLLAAVILLPGLVFAAGTIQRVFTQAQELVPVPAAVSISPGEIITGIGFNPITVSALAYDQSGRPITTGVSYEWGISSNNSIAKLTINGNIATVYPLNPGTGNLWAKAYNAAGQAVGSIRVIVNSPPANTPTPTPPVLRTIQIISPNGGENLYVGDIYRITWSSSDNIDTVSLGYSFGAGSLNWIATQLKNARYYDWKVNIGNTANTSVRIYIIGYQTGYGSVTDLSDNSFTVLSAKPTSTPLPTPTRTPVQISLKPMDDTFVTSKNNKAVNGTGKLLEADGWPAKENIYLQFLTPNSRAGAIISARLRMKVKNSSVTGQTIHLLPNTAWSENYLTYTSALPLNNVMAEIRPVSLSGTWLDINLPGLAIPLAALGERFTLGISAPSSSFDALGIYSKETSYPPELLLTIQP